MLSRRDLLATAALAVCCRPSAAGAPILGDDGLYRQSWFLDSLLELADDLSAASERGKRLVIVWELKGCPACRETHLVNFADPAIAAFISERFDVLQLNIIGAREVTDFDGEKLSEKRFAQKYGVSATPTFQFFPTTLPGLAGRKPAEREVARAQGYLPPKRFLAMFRFVAERRYESETLNDFLQSAI